MKACVFDGRRVRVDPDYPEPEVPPGEVPVRVDLAGVCRTDLEIVKGYMGFTGVLGHEFVGTAIAGRYEGRRVVGGINCVCGECDMCRAGYPTHCRRRTVLGIECRDGAFTERLALPEENLVPVPEGVPDEDAVFAEPLAAAIQVVRQVEVGPGRRVVVLGDGRLGQLVARVVAGEGAQLTVLGKSEPKLAILRQIGIDVRDVEDVEPAGNVDLVVECSGTAGGLATAMGLVRPRGVICLKSTVADTAGLNLAPLVVNEVTVVGSRCGPMDAAVAMLAEKDLTLGPLITGEFPLGEAPAALEAADAPNAIKVLVRP